MPLKPNALVGIDFSRMCDEVAKDLDAKHEAARFTNDAGESEKDFTTVSARVWMDLKSGFWMSAPLSPQPFVGMFFARGRNREHAMKELRFCHARAWHERGGMDDWDAARRHCARYHYVFEDEDA